jgi:LruC domain-containing protein
MKTKFTLLNFLALFLLTAIVAGCVRVRPDNNIIESPIGAIPPEFDWKTVKELSCTVRVNSVAGIGDNLIRIIKIYNSVLMNEGSMIASGAAKPASPFIVNITLPSAIPTIYIKETLPNGTSTVKSVDVTSANMDVTMTKSQSMSLQAITKSSPAPSFTIPTNFDVTINNQNSIGIIGFGSGESSAYGNEYKSYLIPSGFTRTAKIDFGNWLSHAFLFVQGTYSPTKKNDKKVSLSRSSIVVLSGGVVDISELSAGYTLNDVITVYVAPGGTLIVSGDISISDGKSSINRGTITCTGNATFAQSTSLYNESSLTVSKAGETKYLAITNNSYIYNNGTLNVDKFDVTVSASMLNDAGASVDCKIWTQTNGSIINNHGDITATTSYSTTSSTVLNNHCNVTTSEASMQGATINMYDGSIFNSQVFKPNNLTVNLYGGSMIQTVDLSNIYALKVLSTSDTYSLFKCTGNVADFRYTSSEFNGKIEMVHLNLVEGSGTNGRLLYEPFFSNGAILSKTQTKNIAATSCNGGLGQIETPDPPTTDNDGDGVTSEYDVDDNNPNVAFVSYFPSQSTWGTYTFEDLWPSKGDYDVNDMVIGFRIAYYTNTSNMVTEMGFDYNMRAAGSVYSLGAAFQLDNILASNIQSVTGQSLAGTAPFAINATGVEIGVNHAVIPLFNNQGASFLNTIIGEYTATTDKNIRIKFVSPLQQSLVAISSFNMFITVNTRGKEVHLPGYTVTTKFDPTFASGAPLFPGDIYKYADGMMWGLMFPGYFRYPAEYESIADAYTHFAEWATSGGTVYQDWYEPISGYTNEALIYTY